MKPKVKVTRAYAVFSPSSGRIIETDGKPWIAMKRSTMVGIVLPFWRKYVHPVEIRPLKKRSRSVRSR